MVRVSSLLCAVALAACGGSAPQLAPLGAPTPSTVPVNQLTNIVISVSVTDEDGDFSTLLAALVNPDGTETQTEVDVSQQVNGARNATVGLQLAVAPEVAGVYTVRIIASDEADNESAPQETSFTATAE